MLAKQLAAAVYKSIQNDNGPATGKKKKEIPPPPEKTCKTINGYIFSLFLSCRYKAIIESAREKNGEKKEQGE